MPLSAFVVLVVGAAISFVIRYHMVARTTQVKLQRIGIDFDGSCRRAAERRLRER